MKYTLQENLSETSGVSSNLHGFFHCFHDHGFKNKWTGYWAPPYKFLDYYAVKINGVWLGPDTIHGTEYGEDFVFHHELDSLRVDETVSTPDGLPGFKVTLYIENKTGEPKAARIALETGVDIREKSDDIGPENYNLDEGARRLSVSANDRKLMVSTENDFELQDESYVKEHHPGERQRCFVPGTMVFHEEIEPGDSRELEIEFSTSNGSFGSIEKVEQEFLEEDLGRTFHEAIDSMENLIYDREGKGIIAGHPWFQSYWARDTFWSVLGLIDAGHLELSHDILENFAENDIPTRIFLEGDGDDVPRADTEPLFIIACDKLDRHHGIDDSLKDAMDKAMDRLELNKNIVEHAPEATWMDTLERPNSVDVQSLWLKAAEIMDDPRAEKLEKGLKKFQNGDYMKDYMTEEPPRTINPAVPLMLDQVEEENADKYLEKINAGFSSRYGSRTRSMADPGYDSSGYHTGSVWGLTTGWAAAANLNHGKCKQGLNLLEKMTEFLDRDQLGALPEVVDAETGEMLGASEQAWSAGMFIHVIDTYLLGIDVREDHVRIDPCDITCERKGKRIRGERLDLSIERGEVEVLNDPDLDIRL